MKTIIIFLTIAILTFNLQAQVKIIGDTQRGEPVNVQFTFPVNFVLN